MPEAEQILSNLGKLRTADHARLMADNQRTLDAVAQQDRWSRDLTRRMEEAAAKLQYGAALPLPGEPAKEDPVQILIDSPVTIQQPSQAAAVPQSAPTAAAQQIPAAVQPAVSTAAKIAPWLLAASAAMGPLGLLAGGMAAWMASQAATPVTATPAAAAPAPNLPVYDVERWTPPQ